MGFFSPAEKLNDPKPFSVLSGQNGDVVLGPITAFRVVETAASAGKVRFLARSSLTTDTAAAGYVLTVDSPDSGWIFADDTTHLRVFADTGNVEGQVYTMSRV